MPRRQKASEVTEGRGVIGISSKANRVVSLWVERGYTPSKVQAVNRLILWLGGAPESFQQAVLAGVPEDMKEDFIRRATEYVKGFVEGVATGKYSLKLSEILADDDGPAEPVEVDVREPGAAGVKREAHVRRPIQP